MATKQLIQRQGYKVELIRTKREKTVAIKVDKGMVSMRVPADLLMDKITDILAKKHSWIVKSLASQQAMPQVNEKQYIVGERFFYLGNSYPLAIEYGKAKDVKLSLGQLVVTLPNKRNQSVQVKNALYQWYRVKAEAIITEKVIRFKKIIGVEPKTLRFKYLKRRWGSCDSNGCLDFNWLIIQAPSYIIDYLVVHELTHLAYFSHSEHFWNEVRLHISNYTECEKWLRNNGHTLMI